METTENQSQIAIRGSLIAGGCVLLALVGLLLPSRSPAPPPAASAPPATTPVEKAAPSSSWAPGAEPRVTFAHTMPRTQGTQIFNNTGTPNPDMIMVAIPDGAKGVRFVRGSDPAAVHYIAETKAEQGRLTFDSGPADVDTGEIANYGPLKGRATRRVRLGSDPK